MIVLDILGLLGVLVAVALVHATRQRVRRLEAALAAGDPRRAAAPHTGSPHQP